MTDQAGRGAPGRVLQITDLEAAAERSGDAFHEFLRVPALSAGVYRLPAAGVDPQRPHTEDEVYYVVSGRARFMFGPQPDEGQGGGAGRSGNKAVGPGSIIYVPAGIEHKFVEIEEDLTVLVFFAPQETRPETRN